MKLNNFNYQKNKGAKSILLFLLFFSLSAFLACDFLDEVKENEDHNEEDPLELAVEHAIHHLEENAINKAAGNHFSNAVELPKVHTPYRIALVSNSLANYSGYCQFVAKGDELLVVFSSLIDYTLYNSNQSTVASEKSGEKDGEYSYGLFDVVEEQTYYLELTSSNNTVILVNEYLSEDGHDDH